MVMFILLAAVVLEYVNPPETLMREPETIADVDGIEFKVKFNDSKITVKFADAVSGPNVVFAFNWRTCLVAKMVEV